EGLVVFTQLEVTVAHDAVVDRIGRPQVAIAFRHGDRVAETVLRQINLGEQAIRIVVRDVAVERTLQRPLGFDRQPGVAGRARLPEENVGQHDGLADVSRMNAECLAEAATRWSRPSREVVVPRAPTRTGRVSPACPRRTSRQLAKATIAAVAPRI